MNRYFCALIFSSILFIPILASADGGMVYWPPDIYLDQSAQNAIAAWNGSEEVIILSNDIQADAEVTALRIVPLPSDPGEIKEGKFESFEKLVDIIDEKLEEIRPSWQGLGKETTGASDSGIEITFHEQIGAHDVTVVKVNDLDYFLDWIKDFAEDKELAVKEISSDFEEGVKNYLQRDIKYFVFDVIEAGTEKESIEPLVYRFDSDYLFYPLLMTGISEIGESKAEIELFLIFEKDAEWPNVPYSYYGMLEYRGAKTDYSWFYDYGYPVELSQSELEQVSEDVAALFENGAQVSATSLYATFNEVKRDLMIFPDWVWDADLSFGARSETVKTLQKTLINEGVWDSEVEATGYFGPITTGALAEFQKEYAQDILTTQDLEKGTGVFDSKTKDYFQQLSIEMEKIAVEISWEKNLKIGMSGDDVLTLQEILIAEGVWSRPDIGATGYFGPITKQAVTAFQEKHTQEILEPVGLELGTGFVGPSTRSYLDKLQIAPVSENSYYGSSTLGPCETDTDCLTSGCNSEICQSKSEEPLASICIVPEKPIPGQLGYSCACVDQKCQWTK